MIPSGGDPRVREKNLEIIIDNIKQFYEERLGHLLLTVPDTYKLGRDPERHVAEIKLLLLLLLGCAVQCSNKEDFITRIKTLNVDVQLEITDFIKQITDDQDIVMTQESMVNVNMGNVFTKVKKLLQEKNAHLSKLKCLQSSNVDGNEICSGNADASANRILQAKVAALAAASKVLESEKAMLQTNVIGLEFHASLESDQVAFLAREKSHLEASIVKITNEHQALQRLYAKLDRDQKWLETLHTQLWTQYRRLTKSSNKLESDLTDLISQITALLMEYHELIVDSLDEKRKPDVDKLYRQKEKLEENMMEHYRKLGSVRRVRKTNCWSLFKCANSRSPSNADTCTVPSVDYFQKLTTFVNDQKNKDKGGGGDDGDADKEARRQQQDN